MPDHVVETTLTDREETRRECLEGLKTMMEGDDYLCNLQTEDQYLIRFVECADLDVQKAFDKVKLFYDSIREAPDWYHAGCPEDKRLIIDKDIRIMPLEFDKGGRPLYVVKLCTMDSSSMDLVEDVIAVDDYFIEYLMLAGTEVSSNGLCVIIDIANFSWRLMKWLTPGNIRQCVRRILSMPIKEYKFHIVNSSFLIHAAIKVVWPFLPQSIKHGVIFHFANIDGLYEYIDKDVLPVEYGGKKEDPYSKYHSYVYEQNLEIAKSFKLNRVLYLESLNNNTKRVEKCNSHK